ncbi:DUF2971 domain-containing protein [Vibrio parahaemolyticus]|uniref:DUF2971 domain-containing protein n=1 Tax=Vibrio parahaemolyticus TaxID=670 RepID=UPI001E5E6F8C|nr:DUF2971 domain-containing protein [Vibrio parahaemolyticus]MCD2151979.1 DUF2971 domain-containing protein [Vibrio parahaemolyticus]HCJ4668912.1 DUF2971 domain-containing protein [Vibrio parahaemolyticus]
MEYPNVQYLSKYRTLRHPDGSINENTLNILRNRAVWYAAPHTFNDPFDCKIRPLKVPMDGEYIGDFSDMDNLEYYLASRSKEASEKGDSKEFHEFLFKLTQRRNDKLEEQSKNYAVMCFSEIHDHSLMWSHYADEHKGIVITFERTEDNMLGRSSCRPVRYSRHYPRISHAEYWKSRKFASDEHPQDHDVLSMCLFTKYEDWFYEKEWRDIIHNSQGNGQLVELDAKIKGVFFGCRTPEEDKKLVKDILGDTVEYLQMFQDDSGFQLRPMQERQWKAETERLRLLGQYDNFDGHEVMTRYHGKPTYFIDPKVAESFLKNMKFK